VATKHLNSQSDSIIETDSALGPAINEAHK